MSPWIAIPPIVIAIVLWLSRRVLAIRMQKTWLYAWSMRTWVAYGRVSCCHSDMSGEKYTEGRRHVKKGRMLFTTDRWALSTLLVPGDHTHVALCIGQLEPDGPMMLAELTNKGYGEPPLGLRFFQSSRVVVGECEDWDDEYVDLVVKECRTFKGTRYANDFDGDARDGTSYCSQLPWASDVEKRMLVVRSRAPITGQHVVTPDDLLAASNVRIVWDSDQCKPDG